jgi:hypothetical protein
MSLIWGRGLLEGLSRLQPCNRGFHLSATCCKISAGRYKVGVIFLSVVDPAVELDANPDSGRQTNADPDPGQILPSPKVEFLLEKLTLCR